MPKPEEHPTSIRLSRADKRELQKHAKAENRTLTSLIQTIIRQYLAWKAAQQ